MVGVLGKKDLCGSWREGNCVGHRECGEVEERFLGRHKYRGTEKSLLGYIVRWESCFLTMFIVNDADGVTDAS